LKFLLLIFLLITSNVAVAAEFKFDHFKTGFPLTGKHARIKCEDCHSKGSFKTVPKDCVYCHTAGSPVAAVQRPINHIASTNRCDNCHDTNKFSGVAHVDHMEVIGECGTCHNGVTARGKHRNHIQSSNMCSDCHLSTLNFANAKFQHTGITGLCSNCHNGTQATGKAANHFVTHHDCVNCHNTNNWTRVKYAHPGKAEYPGYHATNPPCTWCHAGNSYVSTWLNAAYRPSCAGCHTKEFKPEAHVKVEGAGINYTVGELKNCNGECHTYSDNAITNILRRRSNYHRVTDREFAK
jgi:hypothetical protein